LQRMRRAPAGRRILIGESELDLLRCRRTGQNKRCGDRCDEAAAGQLVPLDHVLTPSILATLFFGRFARYGERASRCPAWWAGSETRLALAPAAASTRCRRPWRRICRAVRSWLSCGESKHATRMLM